ncbi:hypothetical protein KKH82_02215 [Patescibacteria group bacterium]|nr:hypothetical protein [Patescibacteria group bacterium]
MNYLNQVGIYVVDAKTQATPKQYSMSIEQEEEKELTLLLKNEAEKEVHIRVSFADQVMENNKTK